MPALQIIALVVCLAVTAVAVALFAKVVGHFLTVFRLGQADPNRTGDPVARTRTLLREFLGHTRMSRLPVVATAHWFVMVSFGLLFFTLLTAYGQLFSPSFALPLIGHFVPYEWVTELISWASLVGILVLMAIRQRQHPRTLERRSRFYGSTFWQAYYVELTILGVVLCILTLRGLESALARTSGEGHGGVLHFPMTFFIGTAFAGLSVGALEAAIVVVAALKILISMAWLVTISLQPTMGVAWHRFLAFFNIYLKRHADGRTSLGALQPIAVGGTPVDFENIEDLDEDAALGAGKVEDFTWKGLLDFTTCTECGRCQSQCPAWNTEKPLSPKMLVMAMRDHAHAKAPYLLAAEADRDGLPEETRALAEMPLVGDTGYDITEPAGGLQPARAGRGHRPGRPVVLYDVRRLRRAVPRRHRARRRDRGHAPLPGADRVGLPVRARRPVQEPREQVQPLGYGGPGPPRLGQGPAVRGQGHGPGRGGRLRGRLPVLGRLRRRLRGPGEEDDPRRGRAARHRRGQLRRPR